ncbi:MAG: hypothetical protein WD184_01895 [Acidimicrobiia bacterium]
MTSNSDSRLVNVLAVLGGIVFALFVVVLFIVFSGDGIDTAATTTAGTPSSVATTTTSGEGSTTTGADTTSTTDATSTTSAFGGDTETKTNDTLDGDPGRNLTDVRVGDHPDEGYVRVVFNLTGEGSPNYVVGYEDGPFMETSGDTVEVDGEAFLVVHISPARLHDIDSGDPTYTGDLELDPGINPIVQVKFIDDFEASMTWVIGLDAERPFTVRVFQDPLRVIVDIGK